MKRTYIIAEIGINHNGDINLAKKLIDMAAVAGCDAVKFQKRNPDVAVPEDQKSVMRDTPWGRMTYLDYKKKIEFGIPEYEEIADYCHGKIDWSFSVWDLDSLYFSYGFDLPWLKIPSAKINDIELLQKTCCNCIEQGIKLIISTGMSTPEEIDKAVMACKVMEDYYGDFKADLVKTGYDLVIMHTKSTYPCSVEDLNLACIKTLAAKYDRPVGYSGHEFNIGTTCASIYLGAEYLEKHITLDRTMWGTDQMASVEPVGLIKLVQGVRELEKAMGDGVIRVIEGEVPIRKKLRGN